MNMSKSLEKSPYQHYAIVAIILLLTGASIALHQFKVPTIMGEVADSVSMLPQSAPWLMSMFTVTGIFLAIPAGAVTQRFSCKHLIILSALCTAAGSCLGAVATSGWLLLLSRVIEGLGYLMISVAGPIAVSRYVHPARIGSAMGIWAIWVSVGQIIAFNTTPFMFPYLGWRALWYIFAACTGVMAVIVLFGLRTPTLAKDTAPIKTTHPETTSPTLLQALSNKNLILAAFGFICFNYLLIVVVTFFPQYAVSTGRMDIQTASLVASLPMIGCLIGSPIIGRLSDRFGYKRLYMLCLTGAGLGSFLMFAPNNAVLAIGVLLLGLVGLATPGMMYGAVPQLAGGAERQGLSMGIVITFQNLGMFLGTATYPLILALTAMNYQIAAVSLLIFIGVSLLLVKLAKYQR